MTNKFVFSLHIIGRERQATGDRPREENTTESIANTKPEQSNNHTVLCLFDHVLGNMIIHYSRIRVLHPRQGFDDIMEVTKEEQLLEDQTKLIYMLIGRADLHLSPGSIIHSVEKVLEGFSRINSRVLTVIGAMLILPSDSQLIRVKLNEVNKALARLAEKDHHWLFFDPNLAVSLVGEPQKRYFDREGKLNKPGCRIVAQSLVATAKAARMLQKYNALPEK